MPYVRTRSLIEIFNEHNLVPDRGAEIGVLKGKNAKGLLYEFPKLHLFLVDSYSTVHKGRTENDIIKEPNIHRARWRAEKILKRYKDRSTWIIKPSVDAAKEIENNSLDYVFIDATHTTKACCEDITAWLPKVRIGGLLTGHDFSPFYPGVRRAVKRNFRNAYRIKPGYVWYIQVTKEMLFMATR